jgi:tetratricopeptide (TPR) repeat protein
MSRKKRPKTTEKPLVEEAAHECGAYRLLKNRLIPSALFIGLLSLYIHMLCPDIPAGDGGELVTAAATCGIAHPPGYPLFTMLGRLFAFIPSPIVAWRINLMSAVFHAASATLVYAILLLALRHAIPALVGALFMAFSTIFWRYSLVAEVFPLNDFLLSLLLFILFLRAGRISRGNMAAGKTPEKKLLFLWFFLLGLSFSNHLTTVLVLPAFLYFFLKNEPFALRPEVLLSCLLFFLLGLLPYVYLPLASSAGPYLNWDNPSDPAGFLRLISRSDYGTLTLSPTDTIRTSPLLQIPLYLTSLWNEFTPVGIILAAFGLMELFRKNRRLFNFLLLGLITTGPVFLMMGNMNPAKPSFTAVISRFHLMPGLFFSIIIGFGAKFILDIPSCLPEGRSPKKAFSAALAAMLLASVFFPFITNFTPADQRGNHMVREYGEEALLGLPENSILLATGDTFLGSLDYLAAVEKMRPDVMIVEEKVKFPWYVEQLRERCPQLVIPFDRVDMKTSFIRDLVKANIGKFPVFVHQSSDSSLGEYFELLPLGLVTRVLPKGKFPSAREYGKFLRNAPGRIRMDSWKRMSRLQAFDFENEIVFSHAMMYYDIGNAWISLKEYGEAEKSWLKAVAVSPRTAAPYKNLGVLYAYHARSPGAGKLAVGYWQKYLELNPRDPDCEKIKAEIARILRETEGK